VLGIDFATLFTPEYMIALVTLAALEIVLGIDNIVFISILTGKLPPEQRPKARRLGLVVAMVARIALLFSIAWVMRLTKPLFNIPAILWLEHPHPISGKDLILLLGGLFLIFKATIEVHHKLEGGESPAGDNPDPQRRLTGGTFGRVIFQIMLVDIVFSLDSVITAVGMVPAKEGQFANAVAVMVTAVMIAVGVMLIAVNAVSNFVDRHPTVKMLALAFLLLIGVMLVAEGFHQKIPKGYIYFAMAFSLTVEMLNLRMRQRVERKARGGAAAPGHRIAERFANRFPQKP
jgi:predicted tellurium resistance membrane protein TerC